jgi:hypothetical protein
MGILVIVPTAEATLPALDWASAVLQGMPLREPVNMTDKQMERLLLPTTLWDTVNESDEDQLRVSVRPVKVIRYGNDGANGASLPTVTYIDHEGRHLRSHVTEFYATERDAQIARAQILFGPLSEWSPTTRWECAGVLVDAINPTFEKRPDGSLLARATDKHGVVFEGVGDNHKIAVTRCYLCMHYGPNIAIKPSLANLEENTACRSP